MDTFIRFFSDLISVTSMVVCWNSLASNERKINMKKIISLIIIVTICILISSIIIPNPLKLVFNFLFLSFVNYISISKNIKKSIISVIISQLIVLTVELIFIFICAFIIPNITNKMPNNSILILILNILIALMTYFMIKKKIDNKIFKFLDKTTDFLKNSETLGYLFMIITIIIISITESYMKLPIQIILITNVIMAIVFIIITVRMTYVKSQFNKIDSKYQTSLKSLKEYELMIDKFRINTHENKNEFLTIRNMIKDRKTIKYIDKLIDNKIMDNEKIMKKTVKIPEGGLRATIYSKMCLMDKNKINYQLEIAKNIKTTDLIDLDEGIILNICKVLGVFLDNSIEAVKNLKKKQITIEIYKMDNKLNIEITNNFEGNINIDKMSKTKYTTKGEGHGYGLSLVNKIINENKEILENEKEINGNNFTQILKIKM